MLLSESIGNLNILQTQVEGTGASHMQGNGRLTRQRILMLRDREPHPLNFLPGHSSKDNAAFLSCHPFISHQVMDYRGSQDEQTRQIDDDWFTWEYIHD